MYDREAEKGKKINEREILIGESTVLPVSYKQFCSIFKILLFSNGHESNQIENKMPNLVQEYAYHTPYYV